MATLSSRAWSGPSGIKSLMAAAGVTVREDMEVDADDSVPAGDMAENEADMSNTLDFVESSSTVMIAGASADIPKTPS